MIDLDEIQIIELLSNPDVVGFNLVSDQNTIEINGGVLTQDSVVEIYVDGRDDQILKFLISTQYGCTTSNECPIQLKLIKQLEDRGNLVNHKIYADMMDDVELTINGQDPSKYILEYVELPNNYLAHSLTLAVEGYIDSILS